MDIDTKEIEVYVAYNKAIEKSAVNFREHSKQIRMFESLFFYIKELEKTITNEVIHTNILQDRWEQAKFRIRVLTKAIYQINKLISNRENAVLLGPGWTIATIQNIINKVLEVEK